MHLDRAFQLHLLQRLAESYPQPAYHLIDYLKELRGQDEKRYIANIAYLGEHGLVDAAVKYGMESVSVSAPTITARGMDFLADDGGLSAILDTVTVKLHADTIRDLLLAKVDEIPLPAAEKSAIRKQLSTLSGEALKEVTKHLVQKGLHNLPDAVEWFRHLPGLIGA